MRHAINRFLAAEGPLQMYVQQRSYCEPKFIVFAAIKLSCGRIRMMYTGSRPDTSEEGMKKCTEIKSHAEAEKLDRSVKYAAMVAAADESCVRFYRQPVEY